MCTDRGARAQEKRPFSFPRQQRGRPPLCFLARLSGAALAVGDSLQPWSAGIRCLGQVWATLKCGFQAAVDSSRDSKPPFCFQGELSFPRLSPLSLRPFPEPKRSHVTMSFSPLLLLMRGELGSLTCTMGLWSVTPGL